MGRPQDVHEETERLMDRLVVELEGESELGSFKWLGVRADLDDLVGPLAEMARAPLPGADPAKDRGVHAKVRSGKDESKDDDVAGPIDAAEAAKSFRLHHGTSFHDRRGRCFLLDGNYRWDDDGWELPANAKGRIFCRREGDLLEPECAACRNFVPIRNPVAERYARAAIDIVEGEEQEGIWFGDKDYMSIRSVVIDFVEPMLVEAAKRLPERGRHGDGQRHGNRRNLAQ
jgi:hypothetical protein